MATDENTIEGEISEDERDALLSIAHGAVVTSGGVSIQRALSIWIEMILTRGLGPEVYGVYAFGWRLMRMFLRFANLGASRTLLRDLPAFANEPMQKRRSLGLGYVTTAITASVISLLMILSADWVNTVTIEHPTFPLVLRLFAAVLVFTAFVRIHTASLRAEKAANGEVLLKRILRPGARLIAAVTAMALGYSVVGVVGVLAVAMGILSVTAYPVTTSITGIRPTLRQLSLSARHFYNHAIPSALSRIGGLFRTRVDVLLIGIFLTTTAAGVYNVVLVLVEIMAIPLLSFNQLLPSVASGLYFEERLEALNEVYTTVTRLVVTATLPIFAILAVFGQQLLTIFGPEYARGYQVLLVFLVGRFIGNAVGGTGILLSMTNHQYAHMGLEWLLAILNIVLTYLFVIKFGLVGAALGTSIAISIQNLTQLILIHRYEGLWPFDRTFAKPLGAGLGMIGFMALSKSVLTGLKAIVIGSLVGTVVFLVLLRMFGLDRRDLFIVKHLSSQYRNMASSKVSMLR